MKHTLILIPLNSRASLEGECPLCPATPGQNTNSWLVADLHNGYKSLVHLWQSSIADSMLTIQRKVVANSRSVLWPDFGQLHFSERCGSLSNSAYLLQDHSGLKAVLLYNFGIVRNTCVTVSCVFTEQFKATLEWCMKQSQSNKQLQCYWL